MRQTLGDWVIVGVLATGVGAASLAVKAGGAYTVLLGSATGAVIGAAISTKRQETTTARILQGAQEEAQRQRNNLNDDLQSTRSDLRLLQTQVANKNEWEQLQAQLPALTARVDNLRRVEENLGTVEGRFVQRNEELQQVEQRLTTLKQERQNLESSVENLENRVAVINRENPNLPSREQLQQEIEQSRLERSGLQGQISGLQGQITALNSEVERLESQQQSLITVSAQLATNQAELERVTARIAEARSQEQELAQQAASQTSELTQLQSQIQQAQVTISGLSSQITARQAEVRQLESQQQSLINVSAQLATNQAELAQVNERITEARRQEEVLARQAAEQQSTLEQQRADLEFTQRTTERFLSQQQSIEERVNWLTAERNRLEVERQGVLQEIENDRSQVETLEEQMRSLLSVEAELPTRQAELNAVTASIAEARSREQELAQQAASQTRELTQLQSQIQQAQVTISGLSSQITARQAEVRQLESQQQSLINVSAQLATNQAELQQVTASIAEARSREQELAQQAASQTRELTQLQSQIQQAQVTISGLSSQITARQAEVTQLESQQQSLINVSAQLATNQAELQQVTASIAEARSREQELAQQAASQTRELTQLQSQIQQAQVTISGLSSQITALNAAVEQLESQQESLINVSAQLATNQAELAQVNQRIAEARRQENVVNDRLAEVSSREAALTQQVAEQQRTLSHQTGELEFVRSTYDSLLRQQRSVEERVEQLRPTIDRLEAEKHRILQAIQENQQEYQRYEELRQRLHSLTIEINDKESDLRQLNRDIEPLQGIRVSLDENNARLRQEQENIENEIRRLRGEIDALETSSTVALRALREPLWPPLTNPKLIIGNTAEDEQEFLENFTSYIQAQGLTFPKRVIQAFHTSLKVQDISALVVLAGISGTGKSELPQRYANYIGAQLLTLAVQPRWDSPQDLQGFYNYVEKKFKPTELMRGLYQYNHDRAMSDRIVIVLLDEMNLARVEYYFSEFLSKLETRRSMQETYLEIDVGSLPLPDDDRRLPIPNQFLFVGTMNEDETTQSLSDKVLDRANVLTFGKPQNLRLRQESNAQNGSANPSGYLAYSDFQRWTRLPDPNSSLVASIKQRLDEANGVMEKMGHPFAHRVYQAITQYVVNYPGVENENSEAFRLAISDQFGQKLLPKLRGVMVVEAHEDLDALEGIIAKIGDDPLLKAFKQARAGRYGQFQWQGLIYNEASPVR